MKKKLLALVAVASITTLSGCQMLSGSGASTPSDFANMECDQIKQVFDSYNTSKGLMDTGVSLLSAVGVTGASAASTAAQSSYETAAQFARPVIKMKQCNFTI
ncbi:hypothetical protein I3271_07250 [Photobacterium leiognathi]|uniref:hypothetical protein n=1 Tax=Photobacterium leiognathi TaxID=553611 RepID=UPI001EDF5913|nr:hypothetical protein [Photobacterium leiognathi]MCG3884482.1 hypothetical protein [Photobacterium leiognathi]